MRSRRVFSGWCRRIRPLRTEMRQRPGGLSPFKHNVGASRADGSRLIPVEVLAIPLSPRLHWNPYLWTFHQAPLENPPVVPPVPVDFPVVTGLVGLASSSLRLRTTALPRTRTASICNAPTESS